MKPVLTVTSNDISRAFREDGRTRYERRMAAHQERLLVVRNFEEQWNTTLGHLFECPDRDQIFTWLRMVGWDDQILCECIEDLRCRTNSLPGLDPIDPYNHGLKHFSAALIRKTRAKYGHIRPKVAA
jgi:hypothetical protein